MSESRGSDYPQPSVIRKSAFIRGTRQGFIFPPPGTGEFPGWTIPMPNMSEMIGHGARPYDPLVATQITSGHEAPLVYEMTPATRDTIGHNMREDYARGAATQIMMVYGFAGYLSLITQVILGAPATDIDVTGLNINIHDFYLLIGSLKSNAGVAEDIYLFINGDSTLANYWRQELVANAGVQSPARVNSPSICYLGAGDAGCLIMFIGRDPDGYPRIVDRVNRLAPASVVFDSRTVVKTATVANITQITIHAGEANGLAAGSKVQIYGHGEI